MILARKLINLYRKKGAGAAFRTVKRFVRSGIAEAPLTVRESLGFTAEKVPYRSEESPAPGFRYGPRRVNFVIPSFGRKSGGHMTLFRFAQQLESAGMDLAFYVFGQTEYLSEREITRVVRENYLPLRASFKLCVEDMRPADFVVATEWRTAYAVRDFTACRKKFYFVQDFEPSFYPAGSRAILAEQTYRFGFECVTAGDWLLKKMQEYGNPAVSFRLAKDAGTYHPGSPRAIPPKRVAFYARHSTPRRGFELGVLALEKVLEAHPDAEVVLFGWKEFDDRVGFPYVNAGELEPEALAELYRSSRAGLSLSLTNYSLVPQEMLACGLPVVEADLPSVRAAYPGANGPGIQLVEPTPLRIAEALASILSEGAAEHESRRRAALGLVSELSWEGAMKAAVDRFLQA